MAGPRIVPQGSVESLLEEIETELGPRTAVQVLMQNTEARSARRKTSARARPRSGWEAKGLNSIVPEQPGSLRPVKPRAPKPKEERPTSAGRPGSADGPSVQKLGLPGDKQLSQASLPATLPRQASQDMLSSRGRAGRRGHRQPHATPREVSTAREGGSSESLTETDETEASREDSSSGEEAPTAASPEQRELEREIDTKLAARGARVSARYLLELVADHSAQFSLSNCAACLGRLAEVKHTQEFRELKQDRAWVLLLTRLRALLADLETWSKRPRGANPVGRPGVVAAACCALARLGVRDPALFRLFPQCVGQLLVHFSTSELASLCWGLAKAEVSGCGELFGRVADIVRPRILALEFKPAAAAMLLWAFAKSDQDGAPLFSALADQQVCEKLGPKLSPQELSNSVWACAKLGHAPEALFQEVATRAAPRVAEFTATEVSNLVWAFAQAGCIDETLFKAVARNVLPRLAEFPAGQQHSLLWGILKAYTRDVGAHKCGCGRVVVKI